MAGMEMSMGMGMRMELEQSLPSRRVVRPAYTTDRKLPRTEHVEEAGQALREMLGPDSRDNNHRRISKFLENNRSIAPFILEYRPTLESPTPLMLAAANSTDLLVFNALRNAGARMNQQARDGMNALMMAARHNPQAKNAVNRMISLGTRWYETDKAGRTPLFYAVESRHDPISTVIALQEAGTDINRADNDGMTPLLYAERFAPHLVDALFDLGARFPCSDTVIRKTAVAFTYGGRQR